LRRFPFLICLDTQNKPQKREIDINKVSHAKGDISIDRYDKKELTGLIQKANKNYAIMLPM